MSYLFKNSDNNKLDLDEWERVYKSDSGDAYISSESREPSGQAPSRNQERDTKVSAWIDQWLSNIKGNSGRKAALISHLDRKGSKARRAVKGSLWNSTKNSLSKKHRGEQIYEWFIAVIESNLAPYSGSNVIPGLESEHFNPYGLFTLDWTTEILHTESNPGEHVGESLESCKSKVTMQIDVWNAMDEASKHKFIIHELGHWWDWLVGCLSHSEGSFLNEDQEGWAMHEDGEVRWSIEPSVYSTEQLRHRSSLIGAIYSDASLWKRISRQFNESGKFINSFEAAIARGLNDSDFDFGISIIPDAGDPDLWPYSKMKDDELSMSLANCKDFLPTSNRHATNPPEMYAFLTMEWLRGAAMEEAHFNMLKKAKDYLNEINWENADCDQAREARAVADKITMLNGSPFRFTALLYLNTDAGWPSFNRWVNGLAETEYPDKTSDTEYYDPTAGTATASYYTKSIIKLSMALNDMGLDDHSARVAKIIDKI